MNILPYVFAFGMVVLGPLFSLVAHFCLGSSLGGHSLPLAHLSGASFRSPLGCSVLVQFLVNQSLASVMIFIVSVLLGRLVGCSMPMFLDMCLAFAFRSLVSTLLLDGCPWSFAIIIALRSKVVAPWMVSLLCCMDVCNCVTVYSSVLLHMAL